MYCFMFLVPRVNGRNVTVYENAGEAAVQFERSGQLDSNVTIHVATVDGTAVG